MSFDFDERVDRRGTDCCKWDVGKDVLPMWIADMDFRTAPCVREAINKRAAHGVFGYSDVPEEWYEACVRWWRDRHGFELKKEGLVFCTGAVPAISSAVRKLTTPAEEVVLLTPCYNIFYNSVLNAGRKVVECPLVYESGAYRIDFDLLEGVFSSPQARMMILCDPQNPTGNIWSRQELSRIGELAKKHYITVISDELHCDLTEPGYDYTPFISAGPECREVGIACLSASKSFNLAGMQSAAVYTENMSLFYRMRMALNSDEVAEPNSFAAVTAVAAWTDGAGWLDELRSYLFENRRTAEEYIRSQLPSVSPVRSHATYLMWFDISGTGLGSSEASELCIEHGLMLNPGHEYGGNGDSFLRMNLACRRELLLEGLGRLKAALDL